MAKRARVCLCPELGSSKGSLAAQQCHQSPGSFHLSIWPTPVGQQCLLYEDMQGGCSDFTHQNLQQQEGGESSLYVALGNWVT